MQNRLKLTRPTPEELGNAFLETTNCLAPEKNKKYESGKEIAVRAIAEYEKMGAVVLSYIGTIAPDSGHTQLPPSGPRTFGVPDDLIIKMQQADTNRPVHIFILCDDLNEKKNIVAMLQKTADEQKLAFDPELIHLIPWDTDTYWTRDYSPWWVENKETKRIGISKHIYTTLGGGSVGFVEGAEHADPLQGSGIFRCNDDYGAVKISDYLNAPIRRWNKAAEDADLKMKKIPTHTWFFSGLLNVGGNYMTTSDGTIASSYLVAMQNQLPTDVYPDNPKPAPEVLDNRMNYIMDQTNLFLGAKKYLVFTDPTGTYIGHIDCWAKFLSDRKVLVARSEDEEINKAFNAISAFFEKESFEVFRVMCQKIYVVTETEGSATTAPYTNSLILNDHVYVPLAGKGYEQDDENALQVYRDAMPDHTIVGIIGKPETPWMGTDALHCRTNTIPREIIDNWLKSLKKEGKNVKTEPETTLPGAGE